MCCPRLSRGAYETSSIQSHGTTMLPLALCLLISGCLVPPGTLSEESKPEASIPPATVGVSPPTTAAVNFCPEGCAPEYPCTGTSAENARCRGQFIDGPVDWDPVKGERFLTTIPGTVVDLLTNLYWSSEAAQYRTWVEAKSACTQSWRLPTKAELESIVDLGHAFPAIDEKAFPGTKVAGSDGFWSASTYAGDSGSAWAVHFGDGGSAIEPVTNRFQVRCVK